MLTDLKFSELDPGPLNTRSVCMQWSPAHCSKWGTDPPDHRLKPQPMHSCLLTRSGRTEPHLHSPHNELCGGSGAGGEDGTINVDGKCLSLSPSRGE